MFQEDPTKTNPESRGSSIDSVTHQSLALAFGVTAALVFMCSVAEPCMRPFTCYISMLMGSLFLIFLYRSLPQNPLRAFVEWHHPRTYPSFSAPLPLKRPATPLPDSYEALSGTDLQYTVAHEIQALSLTDWESIVPKEKLFLRPAYLRSLELAPPDSTQFRYAMLFKEGRPVAVAYFQLISVRLEQLGNDIDAGWAKKVLGSARAVFGRNDDDASLRILMCGNALMSGEYGFHHSDALEPEEAFYALGLLLQQLEKAESQSVSFLAAKDFSVTSNEHTVLPIRFGYHSLSAEPAMHVTLDPAWSSFDDYVNAMTKKYRKRVRDARKKAKGVTTRSLDAFELQQRSQKIKELFQAVVGNAGFVLTTATPASFVRLKDALGDDFVFTAYELEDEMVGFSVAFVTDSHLDAHLVGLDYESNRSHALYQNMLYDFVELGIKHKAPSVHMGRTALEIKSTVGAEAHDLAFYVRHPNPVANQLLRPLVGLVPQKEWVPRHPFKEQE